MYDRLSQQATGKNDYTMKVYKNVKEEHCSPNG